MLWFSENMYFADYGVLKDAIPFPGETSRKYWVFNLIQIEEVSGIKLMKEFFKKSN